ncbi:hypothetical protein Pcac1_g18272 [Phytophthora cactorum]|uniref:Uncharacterized protein n=1 Tax=Phytophthora cactorum TaxID=29920 RepID=A0A8T1G7P3_9STRA|nr:hypothetical protein Pcac1_g18272 [Phytophthora cactorum]KAG2838529.1 hypothetical protein PC111_g4199 [Phytophthora cactorum]KAG2990877.1 hypothetical protein PC118_g5379 [Phytophthora cactorum]
MKKEKRLPATGRIYLPVMTPSKLYDSRCLDYGHLTTSQKWNQKTLMNAVREI